MSRRTDRDAALRAAEALAEAEVAYEKAKKAAPRCDKCGRRSLKAPRRSKGEQAALESLQELRAAWRSEWQPKLARLGITASLVGLIREEILNGD